MLRDEDELTVAGGEDRVAHVLFSTAADDLGLYGKPMARNAQIWTHDFRLLLDGPRADGAAIERAAAALREGGHFGYRFLFPAMQVGRHEVYWHRPLVAFLGANSSAPEILPHAPLGYLTAYSVDRPRLDRAVELWPRLLARRPHVAALYGFLPTAGHEHHTTLHNARKVLDAYDLWDGGPLPADFARALLMAPKRRHSSSGCVGWRPERSILWPGPCWPRDCGSGLHLAPLALWERGRERGNCKMQIAKCKLQSVSF